MFFLVDKELKIIFGWSAKCGCTHIKLIYTFCMESTNNKSIIYYDKLPNDMENYTTIIISRNPYKRIISGFLDKYRKGGPYRPLWKYDTVTFSKFTDELAKNDWKMINLHHFTAQTTEAFNRNKILMSKCIKCYNLENIDYNYIENLYNVKLPEELLSKKQGHERNKYDSNLEEYIYDVDMDQYYNFNVDIKYFYNEEIKNKVYQFYENDFIFFNELGVDYINTTF